MLQISKGKSDTARCEPPAAAQRGGRHPRKITVDLFPAKRYSPLLRGFRRVPDPEGREKMEDGMFGYSPADWIFIAGVMAVIFFFVMLSGMRKRK